jgi:hypothetical protein
MLANHYHGGNVYMWHDYTYQGHTLIVRYFPSTIIVQLARKSKYIDHNCTYGHIQTK